MSEDEVLSMLRTLDTRLTKLEALPDVMEKQTEAVNKVASVLDRFATVLETTNEIISKTVPLPIVGWIFGIVFLLIGGISAIVHFFKPQ
jgi:hypothetical protein